MNFHLLFVHFPIALFTIYALLELISITKLNDLPYWFYVKAALVIIGSVSAYFTLETGSLIERQFRFVHTLVDIHSNWAAVATIAFSVIAAAYGVVWINRQWQLDQKTINVVSGIWKLLTILANLLLKRWLLFILALFGLVAITITGALGGAIAQGPDIDPIVHFVYHLYFTK